MILVTLSMACILQINKFNSTSGTLCAHHNERALLSIEILFAQKFKRINVFLGPLPPLPTLFPNFLTWGPQIRKAPVRWVWGLKSELFLGCRASWELMKADCREISIETSWISGQSLLLPLATSKPLLLAISLGGGEEWKHHNCPFSRQSGSLDSVLGVYTTKIIKEKILQC